MKKLIFVLFAIAANVEVNAQGAASAYLDINNVKARVNCEGSMFWDLMNGQFEVPKGGGVGTIFADALWIGGIDAGANLHIAAQNYRQTGTDFWPGPLNNVGNTDSTVSAAFNRIWKLRKCDIDAYHTWIVTGMIGPCPVDSTTVNNIITWPTVHPFGGSLAPYFDYNVDGGYDPSSGDFPLIKGDQAAFFVYNDRENVHGETGGTSLGVEIQTMAYEYNCPDSALQNTVYVDYRIVNKSSFTYYNSYVGKWTDFDIGNWDDDYVGCDVTRGAFYGYNGDGNDVGGYGTHPGAQAVVFLKGPYADSNGMADPTDSTANGGGYGDSIVDNETLGLTKFMTFSNDSHPVNGNPNSAQHFYNFLSGYWKDNTPWVYGGNGTGLGVTTNYMFPGNSDPDGFSTNSGLPMPFWDEASAGRTPNDRRGVGASGPFTFMPGAVHELEVAYVFGRSANDTGALAGVNEMRVRIDSVRAKYNRGQQGCGCNVLAAGIETIDNTMSLSVYPNPVSAILYIERSLETKTASLIITDITGRVVISSEMNSSTRSIDVSSLTDGLYILKVTDGKNTSVQRFIKQ